MTVDSAWHAHKFVNQFTYKLPTVLHVCAPSPTSYILS